MEFTVSLAQRELQERARRLAADFATRAAQHDRDASDPVENYAALRDAGFFGLNVPAELGGGGVGLLGWSLAAEELAQGCGSTALSFNMHLSVVGPMMESPLVPRATKERLAKMVVGEGKLIGGNFSEPSTSGLVGTPVPLTRARKVDGGYRITGRKAFASMGFNAPASNTNFLMVPIGRDTRAFKDACAKHGILVGRPFPPLTTHSRISIGTMDEMKRAVDVFKQVLSNAAN